MNVTPKNPSAVTLRPPQLIQSLVGGFNAVANNIYLIVLPVILDLLLWFGPHLRLKTLLEPAVVSSLRFLRENGTPEMRTMLDSIQNLWTMLLGQFNLLSSISTFPIGVPALMVGQQPMKTPLGSPAIYEMQSFGQLFLAWLGLIIIGLLLGSIYYAGIARVCGKIISQQEARLGIETECPGGSSTRLVGTGPTNWVPPFRPGTLLWEAIQVMIFVVLLLGILLVLMVPSVLITSLLALASPFIAQMALLLIAFSVLWFMVPLVFSPHGIFLCGQSVFSAMLNSMRLVRYILPGTGMFLLALIVLNEGLSLLWRTPSDTSWMALVGIFGHAFVFTGLLAASFFYYRSGLTYIQALRRALVKSL